MPNRLHVLGLIIVALLLIQALLAAAHPLAGVRAASEPDAHPTAVSTVLPTGEPALTAGTVTVIAEPAVETVVTSEAVESPAATQEPPAATQEPPATPGATPVPAAEPARVATPAVAAASASTPRLTIAKNAGRVGEMIGVSITGFPPSKRVAIRFDGARRTTLTTGEQGAASGSFRIPAATAGLHVISAEGSGVAAARNFRIRPSLTFSATVVQAGYPVTVNLAGFAANARTRIRLYDVGGSTVVLSVWVATTGETGGAVQTFTTKRTLTAGKHRVIATDAAGNSTSAWLTTTAHRPAPPKPDDPAVSQVYERGTSGRREVALTFDAGADRGYAKEILDTLAAYGAKATFGMTGTWAEQHPDLVRRMLRDGHQIINHTWDHPSFTGVSDSGGRVALSREARLLQLEKLATLVSNLTGGYQVAPYWRPPFGDVNASVLRDVAAGGYSATVMWTCDSLGWAGASVSAIVSRCGSSADPGDIVLLHVGAQSLDGPALPALIETLHEGGFALVTVEQLLQP